MTEATINSIMILGVFVGQALATWQSRRAQIKVEQARQVTDAKINVIHQQTNSMRIAAMRTAAVMARRVANMTNLASDEEIAAHAEADLKAAELDQRAIPVGDLIKSQFAKGDVQGEIAESIKQQK